MSFWTKTLFLLVSALLLACNQQPKIPSELKTDSKLKAPPRLEALGDRTAIGLEWEGIDDYNVVGYIVYRSEAGSPLTRLGATYNRFGNHYLDDKVTQGRQYIYVVSYYTKDGRESARSAAIGASTLPMPEPISWLAGGNILPRKAKIIFRPHSNERISGYIIERRDGKKGDWRVAGKLEGRLHAEFVDEKLADGAEYEYRIVAVSFDDLRSRPSEIVITATKPLPPIVTGLSATTKLKGKIDVKWNRAKEDAGGTYRLYASNSDSGGFSQIAEVKPAAGASETIDKEGAERFYKITFVDPDGLESPLQQKAVKGATPAPIAPKK
jgi:fibronectin type 3 domain-containing protein